MRFSLLFCLLFLCVLSLSLAQGTYEDCCLKFVKDVSQNVKKNVDSYRVQKQDGGCNLPAIVFKLRRGKQFCARPEEKWVQDLMKQTDKKTDKQRRRNKHGNHWH